MHVLTQTPPKRAEIRTDTYFYQCSGLADTHRYADADAVAVAVAKLTADDREIASEGPVHF